MSIFATTTPPPPRGTPWPAMGVRLDIGTGAAFGAEAIADAHGIARITAVTPSSGGTVYLQAVHRGNKSGVVAIRPRPIVVHLPGPAKPPFQPPHLPPPGGPH